ncbi:MAG: phosphoribosyltransferase [Flavobacteriia bacterium]|nr:phosphoribosyltransferase [Flavobacteriia bacterium]NBV68685.1 phosphoribosyltransferase [Flavobacteriia bacterium]NBV91470.1 phosphoribosyltransferase [Flavobacteriia bacterium]NBY39798.1 phosphoribosyltransferase [Flavobacteriia bacterium]
MQIILDHAQIQQKIIRLGHQIIENCEDQTKLFIGGIIGNGSILVERLATVITENSNLNIVTFEIDIDKEEPWSRQTHFSIPEKDLKHGYIILVDDVINSGKTLQYALIRFLDQPTLSIKTLALVDRQHRRYPIKADFVGLSLSTTLKNRVDLDLTSPENIAYLK